MNNYLIIRWCETIGKLCNAIGSHHLTLYNKFISKVDTDVFT